MYPLEVKGEKADHEGAELDGFVEKQEPQGRTPRLFLAVRSLLVLAAVLVAFDYFSSFPLGRTKPIQLCTKGKDSHDKVDFNTVDFWNTVCNAMSVIGCVLYLTFSHNSRCRSPSAGINTRIYFGRTATEKSSALGSLSPLTTSMKVRTDHGRQLHWSAYLPRSPQRALLIKDLYYSIQVRSLLHPHISKRVSITSNLGGPGGSGVALIVQLGNTFQQVLGPEFDIVGFDPR